MPLTLNVKQTTLSAVVSEPSCILPKQSTLVEVKATFADSTPVELATVHTVFVSDLVSDLLVVNNSLVASASKLSVTAKAPGVVDVMIRRADQTIIGNAIVTVAAGTVSVVALDLVVNTFADVELAASISDVASMELVTLSFSNQFDLSQDRGFVSASVVMSDGTRRRVTQNDGLIISVVNSNVLSVNSGQTTLTPVAAGTTDVTARLQPSGCNGVIIATSNPVAVTVAPRAPGAISLMATASTLTAPSSTQNPNPMNTFSNIATSSKVTVTFTIGTGSAQRSVLVTDLNLVKVDLNQANGLFGVSQSSPEIIVTPFAGKSGTGTLIVEAVDTTNDVVQASITFTVFSATMKLTAAPFPLFDDYTGIPISELYAFTSASPKRFQQAIVTLEITTTDGVHETVTDISSHTSTSFASTSSALLVNGRKAVGQSSSTTSSVIATFGGLDTPLLIKVIDGPSVSVSSLTDPVFPSTLSGTVGAPATLFNVGATFTDNTKYLTLFDAAGNAAIPGIVQFTAGAPEVATINSATGQATLHSNSRTATVTFTASASGKDSSVSFAGNLVPDVGDVDLGRDEGVPIGSVLVGSVVDVPVRINTDVDLGQLILDIHYDIRELSPKSVHLGGNWHGYATISGDPVNAGSLFALTATTQPSWNVSVESTRGSVRFAGKPKYATRSTAYHVATIQFIALSSGSPALYGETRLMTTFQNDLISIGSPAATAQHPRPFVAGFHAELNKYSPQFSDGLNFTAEVPANADVNSVILELSYTDGDIFAGNRDSKFAVGRVLADGADPVEGYFSIEQDSGQLRVNRSLYPQVATIYSVTIIVTNVAAGTDGNMLRAEKIVTVIVEPANLNSPSISDRTVNVIESHSRYQVITPITATDVDKGLAGRLWYSLVSNPGSLFTIGTLHGYLALSGTKLDYETSQGHQLVVQVCDGGLSPLWTSAKCTNATVTVAVQDANDVSPQFDKISYAPIAVPETATAGEKYTTLQLQASDGDGAAPNNQFSFDIVAGNALGLFAAPEDGSLAAAKDFQAISFPRPKYELHFTVSDLGAPKLTGATTASVNVTVYDVNDHDPVFSNSSFPIEVDENQIYSLPIIRVAATDQDIGVYGAIVYSIPAEQQGQFSIDSTTGDLTVLGQYDAETTTSLAVVVTATDTPASHVEVHDTCYLQCEMYAGQSQASAFLKSSCTQGCRLANLGRDLRDCKDQLCHSYGLATATLSSESGAYCSAGCGFFDMGRSVDTVVTVTIKDINEGAPVFKFASTTSPSFTYSISEFTAANYSLGMIAATDSDRTPTLQNQSLVTLKLSNTEYFHLELVSAGQVKLLLSKQIDYDTGPTEVNLSIIADDGEKNTTAFITVTIVNENDNVPAFTHGSIAINIDDDIAVGSAVATVTATDADSTSPTYSICGGNSSNFFSVDAGGIVTVTDSLVGAISDIAMSSGALLSAPPFADKLILCVEAGDGANSDSINAIFTVYPGTSATRNLFSARRLALARGLGLGPVVNSVGVQAFGINEAAIGRDSNSDLSFSQPLSFFGNEAPGNTGSISSVFSGFQANQVGFSVARKAPTDVVGVILAERVYKGRARLHVAVQLRNADAGVLTSGGTVVMQITPNSELAAIQNDIVTGQCSVAANSNNGICYITSNLLPTAWFGTATADSTVEVKIGISSSPTTYTTIGTSSVVFQDDQQGDPVNNVRVTIPSERIFVGDSVVALVSGHATFQISSFLLRVTAPVGFSISSIVSADASKFSVTVSVESSSASLVVGSLTSTATYGSNSVSAENLLHVTFRADNSATTDAAALVECTILQLVNVKQQDLYPKAQYPTGVDAEFVDFTVTSSTGSGSALPATGSIYVTNNDPTSVLAYVSYPQLINLPALSLGGGTVSRTISTFVAEPKTYNALVPKSSQTALSCSTAQVGVIVSTDCSTIAVASTSLFSGSFAVSVEWAVSSQTTLSSSVSANVWAPVLPVSLTVSDPTLNAVAGLWTANTCQPRYQQTAVAATVEFSDGIETSVPLDVTSIVSTSLVSSNDTVASVFGATVTGNVPGSVTLAFSGVLGGHDSTTSAIDVVDQEVTVAEVAAYVTTGLSASMDTTVVSLPDAVSTAAITAHQKFTYDQQSGAASMVVEYTDGKLYRVLTEDGLSTTSLDQTVVQTDGSSAVSVVGSGEGELVSVVWNSANCSNAQITPLASTTIGISSSIPVPSAVSVTPGSLASELTPADDVLQWTGVATERVFSVALVFSSSSTGNQAVDYTDDSRTQYTVAGPITLEQTSDGKRKIVPSGAAGVATVTISFSHFPSVSTVITISVKRTTSLDIAANPYPSYNRFSNSASHQVQQLVRIGRFSPKMQSAEFKLYLQASDGAASRTVDVTTSSNFIMTSSASFATLTGRVLEGSFGAGSGRVEATINATYAGRVAELPFVLPIDRDVANAVEVSQIFDFAILGRSDGTLTTELGVDSARVVHGVVLSDGTEYSATNLFPSAAGPAVGSLVVFTSSLTAVAAVDSNSGVLSLLENHHSKISITSTSVGDSATSTIEISCNLKPSVLNVDVGAESGIPIGPFAQTSVGQTVSVPVRINVNGYNVHSIKLKLNYNENYLLAVGVVSGANWPSGTILGDRTNDPPGMLEFGGALGESKLSGESQHVATMTFEILSAAVGEVVQFSGEVVEMADASGSDVGTPGRSFDTGLISMLVSGSRRRHGRNSGWTPPKPVHRKRRASCSSPPCDDAACGHSRETGDANGDCVFDLKDAQFAVTYILHDASASGVPASFTSLMHSGAITEMDQDYSGSVDLLDYEYLIKTSFGLYRFVNDLVTLGVCQDQNTDGQMVIQTRLLSAGDIAAPSDQTHVYVDFAHTNPSFTAELESATFTVGAKATYHPTGTSTSSKGAGLYGGIYKAAAVGTDGLFEVRADVSFIRSGIGVSIVVATIDQLGVTKASRFLFLDGARANFVYAASLDVVVDNFSPSLSMYRPSGYNALATFDNLATSAQSINDNAPMFDLGFFSIPILDNHTIGSAVFALPTPSDADSGNFGFTYSLLTTNVPFSIPDITSGIIVLSGGLSSIPISPDHYNLTVAVSDQSLFSSRTIEVDVAVFIVKSDYQVKINESTPVFSTLFDPFHATRTFGLTYTTPTLTGASSFSVGSSSGVLSLTAPLDYDFVRPAATLIYSIPMTVRGNSGISVNTMVDIEVTNTNDNSPAFDSASYSMLVDENGNADQVIAVSTGHGTNVSSSRLLSGTVLSYLVTDGDLGVFGNITNYRIEADSSVSSILSIDNFGTIRTLVPLDAEAITSFSFDVVASDGGTPPLQARAGFTVAVGDVNEFVPVIPIGLTGYVEAATSYPRTLFVVSSIDADRDAPPIEFRTDSVHPIRFDRINASAASVVLVRSVASLVEPGSKVTFNITGFDSALPAKKASVTGLIVVPELPSAIFSSTAGFITVGSESSARSANLGHFVNSGAGSVTATFAGTTLKASKQVRANPRNVLLQHKVLDTNLYINREANETEAHVYVAVSLSTIAADQAGSVATVVAAMHLDSNELLKTSKTAQLQVLSGATTLDLAVPFDWFLSARDRTATISITSNVTGEKQTTQLVLHQTSSTDALEDNGVVSVVAPSAEVYAGDAFTLPVRVRSTGGLSEFQLTVEVSGKLVLRSFTQGSSNLLVLSLESTVCSSNMNADGSPCKERLVLLGRSVSKSLMQETVIPMVNLLVEVRQGATSASAESITCTITSLKDAVGTPVGTLPRIATAVDYKSAIVAGPAVVRVYSDTFVALIPAPLRTEFIATDHLTGQRSAAAMPVLGFSPRTHTLAQVTSGLSCTTESTGIGVLPDCSQLFVRSNTTLPDTDVVVTVYHQPSGLLSQVHLKLWVPTLPITLQSKHSSLSPIDGWPSAADCNLPVYQTTTLQASTVLTDGHQSFTADVTELLWGQLKSLTPAVVTVGDRANRTVAGVSPGGGRLVITHPSGANISTELAITTTSSPVHVLGITTLMSIQPGLVISAPTEIQTNSTDTISVSYSSTFVSPGQTAELFGFAVLSDGRIAHLLDTDLQVNFSVTGVVQLSGSGLLEAVAPGEVEVALKSFSRGCGELVAIGSASIDTALNRFVPTFADPSASFELLENTAESQELGTITTSDQDVDRTDPIFFGIVDIVATSALTNTTVAIKRSSISSMFSIGYTSGLLSSRPGLHLDYELYHSFQVGVVISNYGEEISTAVASGVFLSAAASYGQFAINLADINDNAPVLSRQLYRARAIPDAKPNQTVGVVYASDADTGVNKVVSFSFAGNATSPTSLAAGTLSLHAVTGVISMSPNVAGDLNDATYSIRAADGGEPSLSSTANVSFEVYNASNLAYIDLCLTESDFAQYNDQFGVIIGAQLSVALFTAQVSSSVCTAGATVKTTPSPPVRSRRGVGSSATRIVIMQVQDVYAGVGQQALSSRLQDVHISSAYGSMSGSELAVILGQFNFRNAFGVDASVGAYVDAFQPQPIDMSLTTNGPLGNGGVGIAGASSSTSSSGNTLSVSGIVLITVLIALLLIGLLVVVYRRNKASDSKEAKAPLPPGFMFSFSGGEVDPETGMAFFTQAQTGQPSHYHPSGVMATPRGVAESSFFNGSVEQGRHGAGQGANSFPEGGAAYATQNFLAAPDPLSPLHNDLELGADFNNPLYKMGAADDSPSAAVEGAQVNSQPNSPGVPPGKLFARTASNVGATETGFVQDFEAYLKL